MKILKPVSTSQTIFIQPRKSDFFSVDESVDDYEDRVVSSSGLLEASDCIYDFFYDINEVSLIIRKDGEGLSQTVNSNSCSLSGNFLEIDFSSTILEEGETYSFSVLFEGDIIYKDKIYATAKDNFTIKHVSVQDEYTTYNPVDDNTYIIR